jgi:acyl transferase domain-containing protein
MVLACERAKRLRELDVAVAAISVVASETDLVAALAALEAPVMIAEHDARRVFRVVGTPAAIQSATKRLAADGFAVTAMADASPLHTPLVEPILDGLAAVAARLQLRLPSIALVSNVTGKAYTAPLDADYWRRHTSECVHYERGLREIIRQGIDVFLEISPRHVLTRPSEETVPGIWLPSLDPDFASDWEHMLGSLGALYERGVSPNWSGFYHGQDRRRIGLPFYPFEHRRCWPD